MINVTDETKTAFRNGGKHILTISFPDIPLTLTNSDIIEESMTIKESIQSGEDLDYVGCCSSSFEIELFDSAYDFTGQKIVVTMKVEGSSEAIPLFYGFCYSCKKKTAYAITRTLIAYDPLAVILQTDCTDWYMGLTFPMRIVDFRNAFWNYFGYDQKYEHGISTETQLINDFIWVSKTLDGKSAISGKQIIEAICQINACFGLFDREGNFTYQYLNDIYEGLYPEDTLFPDDLLYPSSENPDSESFDTAHIIDINYADYTTQCVDKVVITDKEGYQVGVYGDGDNILAIQNNFLAFGITGSESQEAARKIYNKIALIDYVPCDVKATGTPWLECSDVLVFQGQKDIIRSYILSRTLTGIQLLQDTFITDGNEYRDTELDSVETKLNTLASEISTEVERASSVESGLSSSISTVSTDLGKEIDNRVKDVNGARSQITQTATEIRTEMQSADGALQSSITQTASSIRSEVSDSVTGLSSRIEQNASSITAQAQTITLQGETINLKADKTYVDNLIADKVTAGQVRAMSINADKITSGTIDLNRVSIAGSGGTLGWVTVRGVDGGAYICLGIPR